MNAYRDLTSHITADPGLARLAQVRAHWAVCDDTARAILAAHELDTRKNLPDFGGS